MNLRSCPVLRFGPWLIVLVNLNAMAAAAGEDAMRETILALDDQFWHAGSSHDAQTLERLIADDYLGLGHDGQRWTKAAVLRQYAAVRTADLSVHGEREVMRVNDDAAILMYTAGFIVMSKDGSVLDHARQRLLSCWSRRDGRWVVVFAQVIDAREAEKAAARPAAAPAPGAAERKAEREGIVDKALDAHGGRAKLEAIKRIVLTTRQTDGGGRRTTMRVWVRVPGGYRCEIERPNEAPMICILTGQGMRRWTRDADGRLHELLLSGAEPTMEYWEDHIEYFGPRHILRLVGPEAQVAPLPAEQDAGADRAANPVRIVSKRGGDRTFHLDAANHRLVKERRGDLELLYHDYEMHNGFPIARRVEESAKRHQWAARTQIVEIEFPEALDDKLFDHP